MASVSEKEGREAVQHVPEDLDGLIVHPGVSTAQDGEYEREGIGMNDGLKDRDESYSIHSHTQSSIYGLEEMTEAPAQRTISATSSNRPRPLIAVPRAERRGILARFTVVPEVEKPYHYASSTKWFITFVVAVAAAAAPIGSAILLRMFTINPMSTNNLLAYSRIT